MAGLTEGQRSDGLTGEARVGRVGDGHSFLLRVKPDQEKFCLKTSVSPLTLKADDICITKQEAHGHMTPHHFL